jgi:hypothetical protein
MPRCRGQDQETNLAMKPPTQHRARISARALRVALRVCLLAALLVGCARTAGMGGDGGFTDPDSGGGGGHTPMPQLTGHSSGVITSVQLVTVTFPGYTHRAQVESFGDFVVQSQWLRSVGAEYGVGTGTHLRRVVLPDPAPTSIDNAGVAALLRARIADGTLPAPMSQNDQVFYMVYLPASTQVDSGALRLGGACRDFDGFHDDMTAGGMTNISYAVVLDCGDDLLIPIASQEFIDGLTNPHDGYYLDQPASDPWSVLNLAEAGVLCQNEPMVMEGGFPLERSYSNRAAAAGGSPCVPAVPGEVYYQVSASPATVQQVPAGGTVVFTLAGWSTGQVGDWTLGVSSAGADFDPQAELSAQTMNVGRDVRVTLHVPASARSGQVGGAIVWVGPNNARFWPVAVRVQ